MEAYADSLDEAGRLRIGAAAGGLAGNDVVPANIVAGEAQSSFSRYNPRSMAWSSWKRSVPVLPGSEITKRAVPCLEVLA